MENDMLKDIAKVDLFGGKSFFDYKEDKVEKKKKETKKEEKKETEEVSF